MGAFVCLRVDRSINRCHANANNHGSSGKAGKETRARHLCHTIGVRQERCRVQDWKVKSNQ